MPKYTYQAINSIGEEVSGKLEAESVETAKFVLISRELIPSKIKEQQGSNDWLNALSVMGKVKTMDLIMFTKQFHSMLVAGIPILRILSILEDQQKAKV